MIEVVKLTVCDDGPRDGLQNDPAILEPAVRAELAQRLAATGLPRVEAASFVHPRLVPQMAGAEEVFARSEEHTSELQSRQYLVCRLLLEKKKKNNSRDY